MSETPSGTMALPVQYAANLLASSATFRDLTGAANETAAKAFIHFGETIDYVSNEEPQEIVCPRPRAIVQPDEGQDDERFGVGEWLQTGRITLDIELIIPTDYVIVWNVDSESAQRQKKRDAHVWLWNKLGAIKDEMIASSGGHDADGNPYLNVRQFTAVNGPGPPRTDSGGTWGWVRWSLEWV